MKVKHTSLSHSVNILVVCMFIYTNFHSLCSYTAQLYVSKVICSAVVRPEVCGKQVFLLLLTIFIVHWHSDLRVLCSTTTVDNFIWGEETQKKKKKKRGKRKGGKHSCFWIYSLFIKHDLICYFLKRLFSTSGIFNTVSRTSQLQPWKTILACTHLGNEQNMETE
jgi:hypothetical protein